MQSSKQDRHHYRQRTKVNINMQTQQLPPAENDVAVLLLFFNRTEVLQRTFDAIRKARPAHLFLYQDGPRNEADIPKTEAARRIVTDEEIDWQCDVQRNYQTNNKGVWAATYDSQQWAFGLHDKCIVLEDDSTPAVSFVRFCTEMLHRYEHDQRIWMICGFNHEEQTDAPYDYLFTTVFSIWGWASWRRVVSQWDAHCSVLDDAFNLHQLEACLDNRRQGWKEMIKVMRKRQTLPVPFYETVFWSAITLNNGLTIVPTRNMIQNTAVSADAAHYNVPLKTLPRRLQQLLTMPAHDVTFPLRHPRYVIENVEYKKRVFRIMAWEHPWIKVGRSLEELDRNLRYGNFSHISSSIVQRIRKMTGHCDYT